MFVVFDLDGTLADIGHRIHHVRGGGRTDWDEFFAACGDDLPNIHVIDTLLCHIAGGNRVEIWSARSDVVRRKTEDWLLDNGIPAHLLKHMRADGDNTPDAVLKRSWLHQEETWPDIVYDDRQRVVDMWRAEGIPCFQVIADWEDAGCKIPHSDNGPALTLMIGPSGAGKTQYAKGLPGYISTDELRAEYSGNQQDQSRNDDVFTALHRIAKARLDSGLPVCIDATNLRRRDRLACVALAPIDARVSYVVIDRPLSEKLATAGWRDAVMIKGKTLIEFHHDRFQSAIKDIMRGDGLPNVHVVDLRMLGEVAA
jgi:hypothetical protein